MAINFDHQRDRISTSSGVLTLNTTGAFTIPVGNIDQRPSVLSTGQIRFNSQQQIFEGYDGVGWSSLGGGVRDIDRNTYIIAETAPGVNNNEIDFYTDGVQRMQIGTSGNIIIGNTLTEFTINGSNGNTVISGDLGVNGQTVLASANIQDLTSGRVVLVGTAGELEDDANFTWNGITLVVTGDQTLSGTLDVDSQATVASLNVEDLTSGRVVLAGTSGEIEDSTNLTFDGTDLTTSSLIVSDLTNNRVVLAGVNGALEDDANFRFNGTDFLIGPTGLETFTVNVATGDTTVSGTLTITGSILPSVDVAYDLGSASNRFRDIYLSGTTIDLGGAGISYDSSTNTFQFTTPSSTIAALNLSSNDTDDISEGSTNLYYTDARADARITAASINDFSDVDLTTPPTANQTIIWDAVNNKFIPGDSFSQDNFDSAFTAKSIGDLSDVDTATITPQRGQVLIYDDNTNQWRPGSVSAGGGNTLFTLLNL